MKKFILFSIIILVLAGCGKEVEQELTDGERFEKEYESLNEKDTSYGDVYRTLDIEEENPFVYKEANDILEMIDNKESFVVYFGFSTCPWCRSVIPNLIDVARDLDVYKIYYVDIKEIRDTLSIAEDGSIVLEKEGTKDYLELLEQLDGVLEEYILTDKEGKEIKTGEKRIYAPNIISVVDGVATEMTDGLSPNQTEANMKLTKEMKEESYDKIKCSIQCVVDAKKVCSAKTKC